MPKIPYSPIRFSEYAKDLQRAILELSREQNEMPHGWPIRPKAKMTDPLPALSIVPDNTPSSNVTGIQSGAFQNALAKMRQTVADRQKQALAKIESAVASGTARMDRAADDVATKVDKEISAALQEFSPLSNGSPE